MSTIDEIEFLTFTCPERVDMRTQIVGTLRLLCATPTNNVYIGVERVRMTDGSDRSTVIVLPRNSHVWADTPWDVNDPWLSDLLTRVAEGDAIRSWTWGDAKNMAQQYCVGYGADGSHEETGLAHGMPVHITLPPHGEAFYLATCNLIWGPTWSLHP